LAIKGRVAPDIRPDNLAFLDIRYSTGYRICLAGYPAGYRIIKIAGYPAN
jgi:hypothetical protein